MGNCTSGKQNRSNKYSSEQNNNLKPGEQLISYNGKQYKINIKEILGTTSTRKNQRSQLNEGQAHTSILVEKGKMLNLQENALTVNGKSEQFILQPFSASSLVARRGKGSQNTIPTTQTMSPV